MLRAASSGTGFDAGGVDSEGVPPNVERSGSHELVDPPSGDAEQSRGLEADEALTELSPTFDGMYAEGGRPSILPERLLKAALLIALYSVRSERAFCEELEYHLLFRWFLDMDPIEHRRARVRWEQPGRPKPTARRS